MGISKRLFDIARANLGALLGDRGEGRSDDELSHYSDEELEAELLLRQDRRRRQEEARRSREAAERAARERAQKRTAPGGGARAAQGTGSARSTGRSAGASRTAGAQAPSSDRARLAVLYAHLETPYGADLATVKRNFRRLLRKVHPDLVGGNPERQRRATEQTQELTTAYNELERLLGQAKGAR